METHVFGTLLFIALVRIPQDSSFTSSTDFIMYAFPVKAQIKLSIKSWTVT